MINPILWLILSFLLVSMSLTAVLVVLVPAIRELSRAARSVEKLCDTINRELPPTLESIRLTSTEINGLTDDVNEGVQNAAHVVKQFDQSVSNARIQAKRLQVSTRSLMAGLGAAWATLTRPEEPHRDRRPQQTSSVLRPTVPRAASRAIDDGSSSQDESPHLPAADTPETNFIPPSPKEAQDHHPADGPLKH